MSDRLNSQPYWLQEPLLTGHGPLPATGGIAVIGSGLAGVSTCYWLQKFGYTDITLIDYQPEKAASFRNCGHILHGTVESFTALEALHGPQQAQEIWQFSVDLCAEVAATTKTLSLDIDYRQDGYLVLAIDAAEDLELRHAVAKMRKNGFESSYLTAAAVQSRGFRNVYGGRFDPASADAHPVKFRNALLSHSLAKGLRYVQSIEVTAVDDRGGHVEVSAGQKIAKFDAVVIASNAYSPLLSDFFATHRLVEPFRGQIICSQPLKQPIEFFQGPHSFDHGYEYAVTTTDGRLMLGGWRQNSETGETGTYDLTVNEKIETGLINFAKHHYKIDEEIIWEHSWSGIMASSRSGLPFIGPTNSPLIFTVSGFTGHGFSWAHGSAKLLAEIMAGKQIPALASLFDPRPLK